MTLAVFLLDRLTKALADRLLELGDPVAVVEPFFHLTYVRNTGAAFGMLSFLDDGFRVPFFVVSSLAAMALLAYLIHKTAGRDRLMLVALSLVLGGAAGNLVDRILYGYVIDFIDWHAGEYHWPAFNIADSGITVGLALLGFELVVRGKTPGEG